MSEDATIVYVVLDRGVARVIGSRLSPGGVGRYVLRTIAQARRDPRQLARLRQLLDWVYGDAAFGVAPAWPAGRSAVDVELAGAQLAEQASDAVAQCAKTAACYATKLAVASAAGQWAAAAAAAAQLQAVQPSPGARAAQAVALLHLGRLDEAERLAAGSEDPAVAWAWAAVAATRGQASEALQRYRAVIARPDASAAERNRGAWLRVWLGTDLSVALTLANQAVADEETAARRNTQAAVEVELGHLHQALQDLQAAIAWRGAPDSSDWYVIGRLYEQLGVTSDAVDAYRKVIDTGEELGCYALAQKRIAALKGTP